MKNKPNPCIVPALPDLNSSEVKKSLPSWEELPRHCQQELIQGLAVLLEQQPELQALLEAFHEPER